MRKKSFTLFAGLVIFALAVPAWAQSRFSFSAGGGPTVPAKGTGQRFDTGYNFSAGVGFHPVRAFGVMGEFGFFKNGINSTTLANVGVPGGGSRIYAFTLNPMIHLIPRGRFDVYLIGGGGYYRRTVEFTEPSSAIATGFDPYFGIFFPVEVATTNVLGSVTQNKMGINGGAGVAVRLGEDGRATLFAESRYHHIYTTPVRTAILPVTFGFRW
jgi:hypothetical protein